MNPEPNSLIQPSLNRLLCALVFGIAASVYMMLFIFLLSYPWSDPQTFSWSTLSPDLESIFAMIIMPGLCSAVAALFMATYFRKDIKRGHSYFSRGLLTSLALTSTTFVMCALIFTLIFREPAYFPAIIIIGGGIYLLPASPIGALAGWIYWQLSKRSLHQSFSVEDVHAGT